MGRTRLYSLVLMACLAGYGWISYLHTTVTHHQTPSMCLFKTITNVPCPSCGSSRSVMAILHGDYWSALSINPIGYVITLILLLSPIWITADILLKRNSFLNFYSAIESIFRIKWVTLMMISLVVANWIWNITKGL